MRERRLQEWVYFHLPACDLYRWHWVAASPELLDLLHGLLRRIAQPGGVLFPIERPQAHPVNNVLEGHLTEGRCCESLRLHHSDRPVLGVTTRDP